MTTGVSRVESDSGKVQGMFEQGAQGGGCGPTPAPTPGAAPPAGGAKPGLPLVLPGKK